MIAVCTLSFAEGSSSSPVVLTRVGRLGRNAFTVDFAAGQALLPVAGLGVSGLTPSGLAGSSVAEWGSSIPVVGACIRD